MVQWLLWRFEIQGGRVDAVVALVPWFGVIKDVPKVGAAIGTGDFGPVQAVGIIG